MSNNYSHISPRDFELVNDYRDVLVYNYAARIHNHSGAKRDVYDLMQMYTAIFGRNWYLQPYKKLVAAAKLGNSSDYTHTKYEPAKVSAISGKIRVAINRDLADSTLPRLVAKFYNKKVVEGIMQNKIYEMREGEMYYWRERMTDLLGIAMFIKKYDKKSLKLLKHAKDYEKVARYSLTIRSEKNAIKENGIIPEAFMRELCHDTARDVAKSIADDESANKELNDIMQNVRDRIHADAYRAKNYGVRARSYHIEHLAKYIREYQVFKEFANIMDELQMEAASCHYGYFRKLNRKVYNAAKQVAKMNVPLAAKQETMRDISARICSTTRYSRVVWTPEIRVKGGK